MKKDIPGYEGYYKIDALGIIYSIRSGKTLSPELSNAGYLRVVLSVKGAKKHYSVHRIMAIAFLENPNNYTQVNHKDGNKLNNVLSNIEWSSPAMNTQHSYDIGLWEGRLKPIIQFSITGEKIAEWKGASHVQKSLGIRKQNISHCCKGKTKTAGGFIWRYLNNC